MKNNEHKSESLFKKKGFYVALYSCLGIVMISAAVMSFTNLLKNDDPSPINTQAELDLGVTDLSDLYPVDNSTVRSYTDQTLPTPVVRVTGTPRPTPPAEEKTDAAVTAEPTATAQPTPVATDKATDAKPEPTEPENKAAEKDDEPSNEVIIAPQASEPEPEPKQETVAFTPYTEDVPMNWPVVGELVMDFSIDRLIYDATLNQYRTNDNLCIAATIGSQVKATAAGVVKDITNTREKGNTIILDHGNGWTTEYSELQDGILVSIGDVVKEGQVIGGVGAPSIYNVLMGSHLQFAVARDGRAIDPKNVLN